MRACVGACVRARACVRWHDLNAHQQFHERIRERKMHAFADARVFWMYIHALCLFY